VTSFIRYLTCRTTTGACQTCSSNAGGFTGCCYSTFTGTRCSLWHLPPVVCWGVGTATVATTATLCLFTVALHLSSGLNRDVHSSAPGFPCQVTKLYLSADGGTTVFERASFGACDVPHQTDSRVTLACTASGCAAALTFHQDMRSRFQASHSAWCRAEQQIFYSALQAVTDWPRNYVVSSGLKNWRVLLLWVRTAGSRNFRSV
jgi:hypothetical protein